MSSSERMLLIITIIVAVIATPFYFWDAISGALGGGAVGSLSAQRDTFHSFVKVVEQKKAITDQYDQITRNNAPGGGEGDVDPGGVFMNDLDRMLRQDFNQPNPKIDPFERSPIPKVEDYYFLDVDVSMTGQIKDLIRLLMQMENSGLLIKEFTLEQRGSIRGGAGQGNLNVTVSRLAQHNENTRKLMARLRK